MTSKPADSDERFEFGANWRRFLELIDDDRINEAQRSLTTMIGRDLEGATFLDVGCGSGLFSLAARRSGAEVHSFDYDPASVACADELRRRYFPDDPRWRVERASALDAAYLESLGTFDVVYAWGVLHHTGDLWQAMANVAPSVKPAGLLFVSIYNDQGARSRIWAHIKRRYVAGPRFLRPVLITGAALWFWLPRVLADTLRGHPLRRWTTYRTNRGMSPWTDLIDWVGGYPFEVATPAAVVAFYRERGFTLTRPVALASSGCNEFVFERSSSPDA